MKKYFYYIVILVVIIGNISLINKNNDLNSKIKSANSRQIKEEKQTKTVDYLYKIANSKFIDNIDSITVDDNVVNITFDLTDDKDIKKIVDDIVAIFERKESSVNVNDDKKLILEFE